MNASLRGWGMSRELETGDTTELYFSYYYTTVCYGGGELPYVYKCYVTIEVGQ